MSRSRKPPSPFDRLAELQKEGKLPALLPPVSEPAKAAPKPAPTPESEEQALRRAFSGVRPLAGREKRVERKVDAPPVVVPKPAGSDDELLSRAFAGVRPLSGDRGRVAKQPVAQGPLRTGTAARPGSDKAAAAGPAPASLLNVEETPARIEGWVPGVDARALRRLRTGDDFPAAPAGTGLVDLHGVRVAEVDAIVRRAVARARAEGLRALLIVTGRGLGSESGVPVVRGAAVEALRRLSDVLAFTTSAPRHGGAGALYVLLRKSRPPEPSPSAR